MEDVVCSNEGGVCVVFEFFMGVVSHVSLFVIGLNRVNG